MKALDTNYNGYRFRSRLEARWAVFMDAIGVKYEYEREAYDLDGLFYLPDFYLPQINAHLEIKNDRPTEDEFEKASRLSRLTKVPTYIVFGQPEMPWSNNLPSSESAQKIQWEEINGLEVCTTDYSYWWCECPHCNRCELHFNGRADRIACGCQKSEHGDKGYNFDSSRLLAAYNKARGYRFDPKGVNV